MTRKLSKFEKSALHEIPIRIPEYEGSHPFSIGENTDIYLEGELKKKSDNKSKRTDFFEKQLFAIWREVNSEVPYAFRVDGQIRSLDAGCLGYLVNRQPSELKLIKDAQGYVVAVVPIGSLTSRYSLIEGQLRRKIRCATQNIENGPPPPRNEQEFDDGSAFESTESRFVDEVVSLCEDGSLTETTRR